MIERNRSRSIRSVAPWRRLCAALGVLLLGAVPTCPASTGNPASADGAIPPIHVSFSSSMFAEVHENDVKAAMKVWAHVLSTEQGLPLDPEISIFNGIPEISSALRNRRFDAIALTTDEYWALEGQMHSDQVIVGLFDGQVTEEYLLLVHRESGIERLSDLRGRSLVKFQNPRMSLADAWLDTLLAEQGLGPASRVLGRETRYNKLARVILPVFFRQSDVCLVHRRGFQTMSELNPQVSEKLKTLAVSPEVMPAGFFFRGDWSHPAKDKLFAEFEKIHLSPAGQQALTVFQSGHLRVHPIAIMKNAFELLENHRRWSARAKGISEKDAGPVPGVARAEWKQ